MDKIDALIKDYLKRRSVPGRRESPAYPDAGVLYAYLADELKGGELERFVELLKNDAETQSLVSRARELFEASGGWEGEKVPSELVQRAQGLMKPKGPSGSCPHCGKPITPFKKPLSAQRWIGAAWLLLAAAAFGLSFVFRFYFMQCLAVALLAGIKGVLEMRAMKTQILIYKALSDDAGSEQGRLHRHSSRL